MDPVNPNNQKKVEESPMENGDLMIMPEAPKTPETPEAPENSTTQNSEPQVTIKNKTVKPKDSCELKPKVLDKKSEQAVEVTSEIEDEELVQSPIVESYSLAEALVKTVIILLLGIGAFALSIFLESAIVPQTDGVFDDRYMVVIPSNKTIEIEFESNIYEINNEYELVGGELIKTKSVSDTMLYLPLKGAVRLGANTEVLVNEFDKEDLKYSLTLNEGNLWGNLLNNFFELRIRSGEVEVIPSLSLFNIESKDNRTNIYAHKHDVLVEILADDKVINKLWIAEGNQAQFANTKIIQVAETIEQLLYSKLVKEFNYSRVSKSKIEEIPWVVNNIQADEKYKESIEEEFVKKIKAIGLTNLSEESLRYQTKGIITELRKALTFTDIKKAKSLIKDIFENINDAAFLYIQGSKVDAGVRLSLFEEDINDIFIEGDEVASELLYNELTASLSDYLSYTPGHKLYLIKELLFKQVFSETPSFELLTLKLNDVYDALNSGVTDTNKILADYFTFYEKLVRKYRVKGINEIQDEIQKQNILLDNLMFLYPDIYKIDIFESKRKVEDDYLNSIQGARDKKEQRQTYISEKINLLNKIQFFLFEELLDPADARQVVFQLISDMEEYKQDTLDAAAVNDLFEIRLKDFGLFWEYLKSDEYATTPLHGDTHTERFEAFTLIQQKNVSFEDIRLEILGMQVEEEVTVEDILENAEEALEVAGIKDVLFGFYQDVDSTKIPVLSATVSGIEFTATYDWDREILSEIIVEDEIVSKEGIKLLKAKAFITDYIATRSRPTVPIEEPDDEPVSKEDELVKAAKVFMAEKFIKQGIAIDYDLIQIISYKEGLYRIEDVFFKKEKEAKFSFDYLSKEDKVTNITITTKNEKVRSIKETFSLVFLDDVVLKIYEEE